MMSVPPSSTPFFTVGHSNQSFEAFVGLLKQPQVGCELLVDIRTLPRSWANPQFNTDTLGPALAREGIAYERIAALGGLRGKSPAIASETNGFWTNKSFHRYADYALTEAFHQGLEELLATGCNRNAALMCAEVLWWRCHRRLVSDYLLALGYKVFHILGLNKVEPARLTAGAVVIPATSSTPLRIEYPAPQAPHPQAGAETPPKPKTKASSKTEGSAENKTERKGAPKAIAITTKGEDT